MPGKALAVLLMLAAAPAGDLGKAVQAYRAGDFKTARALAAPDGALLNRDYALFVAAQAALLDGDPAAALPLFRSLAAAAGSRFREIAAWRAADALWDLGQAEAARAAYRKLVPPTQAPRAQTGDLTDGPLTGDAAVGLDRLGEWRRLAVEYPAHPLAAGAEQRLTAPLTDRERIARAERLTDDRRWEQALAELDKVGQSEPVLRDYWIGMTLFKMRRQYDRSAKLLLGVFPKMGGLAAEALFHAARAFSRADRDDEAIRWYREVIRRYPDTSWAAEAQFLSGWLELNRGRFREAIPGLEATVKRYPKTRFADDAVWYLGLCHHLLGHHAKALKQFEKVATRGGDLEGGKGSYWHARTLLALGRGRDADVELTKLVGDYPFSWYAILARARLAERGKKIGAFGQHPAPATAVTALDSLDADAGAGKDPLIARADELIAAGLGWEAGFELRREEGGFIRRHGAAKALPVLFDRYRRAGNFNRPWELALAYGGAALRVAPEGAARAWWLAAFPLAYREFVEKYRELGKNPSYYLYSIMQKESGYDPHVVSYADAIGLLQMIPPTTRRVAERLGVDYTDDLLYDPELNVETGSWYIGGLLEKFGGQIPVGAGSFNCGPKPVVRWLAQNGKRPLDEWVELVAYTQTREYMKKVTAIYARYLYLYEGTDYQQPLTVDAAAGRPDIEY